MQGRPLLLLCAPLLLPALAGCGGPAPGPGGTPERVAGCGSEFDPDAAVTLSGRVSWAGKRPSVEPYRTPLRPLSGDDPGPRRSWPNPNAPAVDHTNVRTQQLSRFFGDNLGYPFELCVHDSQIDRPLVPT